MNRLFRELRRREVFRTAGLYIGVCWILIEVASVVLPTFDAPEWVMRAIIIVAIVGLPVCVVLAWVYDLTDRGISVQADPTDTIIPPVGSRKMDFLVIGVLSIALILSVYMNIAGGPQEVVAREPLSVLIADFDNQTGDEVFDGSLERALQIGIEAAPFITSYSRRAALRLVKKLLPEVTALDQEGARLVSVREGIRFVLDGAIELDGDGYKITVRAIDGSNGEEFAVSYVEAPSKAEVLSAVGTISGELRKQLGDDNVQIGDAGAIETFTAASIEAAHSYTVAQDLAVNQGKHEQALVAYAQAVELDPNFGRAYSGWALSLSILGRDEEAAELWEKALSRMETMTAREKWRTLGLYYMVVTGNYEKAIESYTQLVEQYPADDAGRNNLAIAYFSTLNFDGALEQGRMVLDIYPARSILRSNYSLYAMYAGDFATADGEARTTLEQDPTRYVSWLPIAMSALAADDAAAAQYAYGQMTTASQRGESVSTLGLADVAMYIGDFAAAETLLESGIQFDSTVNNQRLMATKRVALAAAQSMLGDADAAIESIELALATGGLARQVPAALELLRLGNNSAAMEIAENLQSKLQPQSRAYGLMIEGLVKLADDENVGAIDALREALDFADLWLVRFHLGQAYLGAGYTAEAMDEFETCNRRRGEATALFLDDLPTWRYMATLPYWLGRSQLELGMRDAGAENLRAFVVLRPNGGEMAEEAEALLH
jgi:tetratricopeptide (TPR) repeat protein/TolB-like protein